MKLYKIYEGLILESVTNTIDNLINGETAKTEILFIVQLEYGMKIKTVL